MSQTQKSFNFQQFDGENKVAKSGQIKFVCRAPNLGFAKGSWSSVDEDGSVYKNSKTKIFIH